MMRSSWLALAALLSLTAGARMCGSPRSTSRPSLAWDGDDYISAWRAGPNIYVQLEGRPPQIIYSHPTVGDPTIARTATGLMVSTSRQAEGDRAWRDEILIPLDRHGFPGEPRTIKHGVSAELTCSSQQSFGLFITAYAGHLRDGRPGEVLSVYDARGVQIASDLSVSPFLDRECAVVERNGELAFVERSEWNMVVSVRRAVDLEWIDDPFPLPIQEANTGAPWHMSAAPMASLGRTYGVLLRDREGQLRVTRFSAHGPESSRVLDSDVDATTVDLGHTERGPFVTWVSGRTLHVRGVDTPTERTLETRAGTRVRAGGHWDTCAVAQLAPGGDRVRIADFDACP